MKVVSVKIQGFRGIRSLEFTPSTTNVLVGQVNSGKSTILLAMALVLDPDVGRRQQVVDETDFHGMRLKDEQGNPVPIDIEITLSGLGDEQTNHFFDLLEVWDPKGQKLVEQAADSGALDDPQYEKAVRMAFHAAYDPAEDGVAYHWYYPKFSFGDDETGRRTCPRTDREMVGFFLIPAERDARRALSFARYSALDRALRSDEVHLESQVSDIVDAIRGQGKRLFEKKGFDDIVKEVETHVDRLLRLNPNCERKLLFELTAMVHYDVMNTLRPYVHLEGDSKPYPVALQGMGARQILVLSTLRMLAKRKKSSILAIEEPETGLHPHMQRLLVGDLVYSPGQVFITTHSVHVAEACGTKHVLCLVEKPDGVRHVKCADAESAPGLDKDEKRKVRKLTVHYPPEMIDALFAPAVLLVEGVGDRQALPTLCRKLAQAQDAGLRDLDGLGVAVVPCDSKSEIASAAPYFREHLQKRTFALLDGNRSDTGGLCGADTACDHVFVWPNGQAIERVLLAKASDATLKGYHKLVSEEFGDTYFADKHITDEDAAQLRNGVEQYIKHKNGHRSFAEHLPANEVSLAIRDLLQKLSDVLSDDCSNGVSRLSDAAD